MVGQQKVIDHMVERYSNSVFECEDKDDLDRLKEFQRSVFGSTSRQSRSAFTHWAYLNSSGSKLSFCEKHGEIVGQQGELKTVLHIGDVDVPAVWAVDLWIRPDWRMKGVGVALIGRLLRNNPVVLGLGLSGEARKMFTRQGWLDHGRVDSLLKPVSPAGFARFKRNQSLVDWIFRRIAFAAFRTLDWLTISACRGSTYSGSVEETDRLDSSFQVVLNEHRRASKICCDRSVEFLNWRFVDCPMADRYKLFTLRDSEGLCGLVVVRRGERNHKDTLYIDELIALRGAQLDLIDFVVGEAYRQKVDAVYYGGLGSDLSRLLRKRRFVRRNDGHHFMVYASDESLKRILGVRDNWSIRLADSDVEFPPES